MSTRTYSRYPRKDAGGATTNMVSCFLLAALVVIFGVVGIVIVAVTSSNVASVETRARHLESSSIKAFQSIDGEQGLVIGGRERVNDVIKNLVDRGTATGGYIHGWVNGAPNTFYYGVRDADFFGGGANPKPWEADSIFTTYSASKIFAAIGMFRAFDKYAVDLITPLSDVIPEFETTPVIVPVLPIAIIGPETDPLSTSAASTTVTVTTTAAHGLTTGDTVALEGTPGAIDGIPEAELITTHVVTVTGVTTFEVTTVTPATAGVVGAGGSITIKVVPTGSKQTVPYDCDPEYHYYTEESRSTRLDLSIVLSYGTGYTIFPSQMASFCIFRTFCPQGYEAQCAVQQALMAANGYIDGFETTGPMVGLDALDRWKILATNVPMICQPGTCFSYDGSAAIMGAVILALDKDPTASYAGTALNRPLDVWMADEIFTPLNMVDTGYIILPSDTDKLDRFVVTTISDSGGLPISFIFPGQAWLSSDPVARHQPRAFINLGTAGFTTAVDYDKVFAMLMRGGNLHDGSRFISKDYIALMSQTQNIHFTASAPGIGPGFASRGLTWGYGVAVTNGGSFTSSPRSMGWTGLTSTPWIVDFGNNVYSHGSIQTFPIPNSALQIFSIHQRNLKANQVNNAQIQNVEIQDAKNGRLNV